MRVRTIGLICVACACSPTKAPPAAEPLHSQECANREDGVSCLDDGRALHCRDEAVVEADDCSERGKVCVPRRGCLTCRPGQGACDGQQRLECSADGSGYEPLEDCEEGLSCSPHGCVDLCARARAERSYIGCEYFPVFTSNDSLDARFEPAVVIANPNLVAASITITRGEDTYRATVPPSGVETVMLKYVPALRTPQGSALVRNGAYRLVSSVPVTVHQFNPLLFEVKQDCIGVEGEGLSEAGDGKCNSFSNDASLLLPSHVLERGPAEGTSYLAIARPSFLGGASESGPFPVKSPGFVAIVGTGAKPVHVTVRSSAYTLGSATALPVPDQPGDSPSPDPIAPLSPGSVLSDVTLQQGDVLQLLSGTPERCAEPAVRTRRPGEFVCPVGPEYDLTGTEIEADGPIEVIAGHNCSYVPFDRVACDHLEETLFPLETWGTEVIAARPRAGRALPNVVRVLSAADDNEVRFEPPVEEPRVLSRGESFELLTTEHLLIRAQKPIAVAQFLVGQDAESRVGDPSMSIAIPTEQYRSSYAFLSPESYDLNYVSIIARAGDVVVLDGNLVSTFVPIADSAFQVASVQLLKPGAHEVHSQHGQGVGVIVYGYGDYTSYMLPGGLDLRVLHILL